MGTTKHTLQGRQDSLGWEGLTREMTFEIWGSGGDVFIPNHFLMYILSECLCL